MDVYDFITYRWEKNPEHKSDGLLLKYLSLRALIEKLARLGYEGEFDRGEGLALRKLVNGISLHLRRFKPNRRNAYGILDYVHILNINFCPFSCEV